MESQVDLQIPAKLVPNDLPRQKGPLHRMVLTVDVDLLRRVLLHYDCRQSVPSGRGANISGLSCALENT